MANVEILCGGNIKKAFKELGINATKTYLGKEEPHYQVWEINKNDLHILENSIWQDNWGYWRYAKGSNMGTPYSFFTVNNEELIAWDGYKRDRLRDDWDAESDEEKASYQYSFKEYEEVNYPHVYENLRTYMCDELGASTEKNVCALAVDLARANGMTMAKLFEIYEG